MKKILHLTVIRDAITPANRRPIPQKNNDNQKLPVKILCQLEK
jgi:hypothetical protein